MSLPQFKITENTTLEEVDEIDEQLRKAGFPKQVTATAIQAFRDYKFSGKQAEDKVVCLGLYRDYGDLTGRELTYLADRKKLFLGAKVEYAWKVASQLLKDGYLYEAKLRPCRVTGRMVRTRDLSIRKPESYVPPVPKMTRKELETLVAHLSRITMNYADKYSDLVNQCRQRGIM
jgi:hypothetical protein